VRTLPGDPLLFIQDCVRARQILWTYHVNLRLARRFVPRQTILDSVDSYEIVESYPDDKYLPSYLVLTHSADEPIHVLFATDVESHTVRVVTAYRPSREEWEVDMKTRKARP
jgi:hypothetical protein